MVNKIYYPSFNLDNWIQKLKVSQICMTIYVWKDSMGWADAITQKTSCCYWLQLHSLISLYPAIGTLNGGKTRNVTLIFIGLFNLRGSDIAYNPVFFAYAIVETEPNTKPRLYLREASNRIAALKSHLNAGKDGTCASYNGNCVEVGSI